MKAVLLSIRPKWCKLIASGKKTIEVRKTRPKIETPFKCYIYCPKGGTLLAHSVDEELYVVNGKVIGEFVCDRIEFFDSAASEFAYAVAPSDIPCVMPMSEDKAMKICNKQGCLSDDDVISYFGDEDWKAYFWHISDLKIYDEPRELGEFHHCGEGYHFNPAVIKPPQSWCYVEELQR